MTIGMDAREVLLGTRLPGGTAVAGRAAAPAPERGSGTQDVFAFGAESLGGPPVTAETCYDLASLTKVVATLPSVLRLVDTGELDLDRSIVHWFSNIGWFRQPSLADATPRQFLAHNSGLPGWSRIFAQTEDRLVALAAAQQTPLETEPGGAAVYSDVGFMLLGALVERISGMRLDEFATRHVFAPLGLSSLHFNPRSAPRQESGPRSAVDRKAGADKATPARRYAATEDCGWRGRLLVGEVHDENCYAWHGVAGHAGLFGAAADLASYCRAWLDLDARLGSEELLRACLSEHAVTADGERRGLGWVLGPVGWAGRADGYGHTGFTGTSLWIDPGQGRYAVLLTNRVHPDRNRMPSVADIREAFHRAVWSQE